MFTDTIRVQAEILEEAGTVAALVQQHYLPALKAHGCAANGCIIAAIDTAAPLAFCLASQLMQLYPAPAPLLDPPTSIPQTAIGQNPRSGHAPSGHASSGTDASDGISTTLGAEGDGRRSPMVEALMMIQSPRMQRLEQLTQQPWFKARALVRAARPEVDMRSFAAKGIHMSSLADQALQMVSQGLCSFHVSERP